MRKSRLLLPAVAATVFALAACSGDPTSPADLAGEFRATTLTLTESGTRTDILAAGGSFVITLTANGTTSGQLSIPAQFNDGVPFNESMTGTFSLTNGIVTFDQSADTFVRDMTFIATRNRLTANKTFDGATIDVVLARQ